jgi:RNA polymerase sigma-70 factor (ECF subfamily)
VASERFEQHALHFDSPRVLPRGTNLRAWLFTILHHTFLNAQRRAHRDPVTADSEMADRAAAVVPVASASPDEALVRAATAEDLQVALDQVPVVFREAVWLRDAEGLSYADIARILRVPAGTVMSRISRGRRLLAQRLGAGRTPNRPAPRVV